MTIKNNTDIKTLRIWEIDAFRGVCILGMIVVHFIYDLNNFTNTRVLLPQIYELVQNNGGILFIILSGISVTLGRKSLKRGIIVFALGILISLITFLFKADYIIKFGILHFLGLCMMLSPILKRLPKWVLGILGIGIIIFGYWINTISVDITWLFPLGITDKSFTSSDYFPLLPYLGYFMIGILLGKTIYKQKKSLLPGKISDILPIRGSKFCGRHSLWIYLIHQPIIVGIFAILTIFK